MRNPISTMLAAMAGLLAFTGLAPTVAWAEDPVQITPSMPKVQVMHQGRPVLIERNQDTFNSVDPDFAMTSRPCPPYCVQPMRVAEGVETIGELELLEYLQRANDDNTILIIDSRDTDWIIRSGLIPGAIHLAWTDLHPGHTDLEKIAETLILRFGATRLGSVWNFENAKTLIMYCNGPWCGQSPTNIRQLMAMGYPAHKLKWYRGGMQLWKSLGFNTVPLTR